MSKSLCATCVHCERESCIDAGAKYERIQRDGFLLTVKCSQYGMKRPRRNGWVVCEDCGYEGFPVVEVCGEFCPKCQSFKVEDVRKLEEVTA